MELELAPHVEAYKDMIDWAAQHGVLSWKNIELNDDWTAWVMLGLDNSVVHVTSITDGRNRHSIEEHNPLTGDPTCADCIALGWARPASVLVVNVCDQTGIDLEAA